MRLPLTLVTCCGSAPEVGFDCKSVVLSVPPFTQPAANNLAALPSMPPAYAPTASCKEAPSMSAPFVIPLPMALVTCCG